MRLFHDLIYYVSMRKCPHPEWRRWCLHGDMINHVGGKRSQCLDCYRYFDDLPKRCSSASIREGRTVYHFPVD